MWRVHIVFLYVFVVGFPVFANPNITEANPSFIKLQGSKLSIGNAIGDIISSPISQWLTGVPLAIAQGATGAGDWLAGVIDKKKDNISPESRKSFLNKYKQAILDRNEETKLNFTQRVKKHGYPVEEFTVKTDDGYILKLFRIPHGNNGDTGDEKPVVFFEHGLGGSSDDYIIQGPNKSMPYLLANAGYDVWLGNDRGNVYSRKHVNKLPSDVSFWDYGWDEIARFDLTASIDFILAETGQKQLNFVGYSQGTTTFFVMCSMKPEYNQKIRRMIALAPVAYMTNIISPVIRLLAPGSNAFDWALKSLGVGAFTPNQEIMAVAGGILCRDRAITQDICTNVLFLASGYNVEQFNASMLPVLMAHYPSGESVRQFLHYGQLANTKDFRRYDFGYIKNKQVYGERVPPNYNLSKVTAPVALFYAENDWFAHPKDFAKLAEGLGNVIEKYKVPNPQFTHLDFAFAKDADKLVYQQMLKTFGQ